MYIVVDKVIRPILFLNGKDSVSKTLFFREVGTSQNVPLCSACFPKEYKYACMQYCPCAMNSNRFCVASVTTYTQLASFDFGVVVLHFVVSPNVTCFWLFSGFLLKSICVIC